jgi:hypothetical protein
MDQLPLERNPETNEEVTAWMTRKPIVLKPVGRKF